MKRLLCCTFWAALVLAPAIQAAQYTDVNPTASTLSFTFNQMGSGTYGTFKRFVGSLSFDTEHPEAAHSRLVIELASIDAGSDTANTELRKPAWFDTTANPQATFESTATQALGDSRYQVTGNLTLRGITRPVTVPFHLKAEGGIGIFEGELTLKRSDFNIGKGEWADTVVSDDIAIKFRLVAPQL
ncbi:YceI family protein [Pseudomonas sp. App30]|uniref:YceI family protein n=1 Tax=Pseudomonas sp. App30 TaxID=3068990 RepID=UPI003A806F3A